jgi:hypothetical protein
MDSKDAVLFTCKADCVDKISKYVVLSHVKWGPWTESQCTWMNLGRRISSTAAIESGFFALTRLVFLGKFDGV